MSGIGKKTILLSGFDDKELSALVDHIRGAPAVGKEAIFAAITETSKTWTVGELLVELENEHKFFQENSKNKKS